MHSEHDRITRNALFEAKKNLIDRTVKKHRSLIRGAHLDEDDVRQELAIRLLKALEDYDPERCSNIDAYIALMLRYRLMHLRNNSKRHGIPKAPRKGFSVLSLNAPGMLGYETEVPSYDDNGNVTWLENVIASLPKPQRDVVDRALSGERVHSHNKNLKAAHDYIRRIIHIIALLSA